MEKKELRREMKARVAAMGEESKKSEARRLFDKLELLPEFQESQSILLYWSLPDEPCSHEFLSKWREKKNLLLPAVIGDELELRRYKGDSDLAVGAFGIKEPIGEPFFDYDKVELALVPGLSFDAAGYRLGRGKGYYDRLLPHLMRATTIGICFECQFENSLPHDEWDVPLKRILYQGE